MYNKTVQTIINAHGSTVKSTDLELPLKALRGTDGEELRELWKETENYTDPLPPSEIQSTFILILDLYVHSTLNMNINVHSKLNMNINVHSTLNMNIENILICENNS